MTNYETLGVNQRRAEPSTGRERAWAGCKRRQGQPQQSQACLPHTPSPCPFSAPFLYWVHTRCHGGQVMGASPSGAVPRGRSGIVAQGLPPNPEVCLGKVSQDKGNLPSEKIPKGRQWQPGRQQRHGPGMTEEAQPQRWLGTRGLWLVLPGEPMPCLCVADGEQRLVCISTGPFGSQLEPLPSGLVAAKPPPLAQPAAGGWHQALY